MPRNMRSKKGRKSSKKESRVGRMRNGTNGGLQLSLKELSANRNYAGAQGHLKMRKDNLRSLKLLANKLNEADSLDNLNIPASQQDGLRKFFVERCDTSKVCFTTKTIDTFPEIKGNKVVKGTGKNPKGQVDFCQLLTKITNNLYKTLPNQRMFAKDRVLLTLKALQEHFSSQMSTSASANTKERSAKTKTAKVRTTSNRASSVKNSSYNYGSLQFNNSQGINLVGDCNYSSLLKEMQTMLNTCKDESVRQDVIDNLTV